MSQRVKVVGAPGYTDEFRAVVVPGLHKVAAVDGRGDLTVITTEVGDIHVVPSRCIEFLDTLPVALRKLVDAIREDGSEAGTWDLPGSDWPRPDSITIGLARFQSYRGRTEAALVQELEDFVRGAPYVRYTVDAARSIVELEV